MSNKTLSYEEYTDKVKNLKTMSDVTNFAKELIAPTLQAMLEAEMTTNGMNFQYSSSMPNQSER